MTNSSAARRRVALEWQVEAMTWDSSPRKVASRGTGETLRISLISGLCWRQRSSIFWRSLMLSSTVWMCRSTRDEARRQGLREKAVPSDFRRQTSLTPRVMTKTLAWSRASRTAARWVS
ncbi:hypothetical protein D3C86_1821670 [compost metagenome]